MGSHPMVNGRDDAHVSRVSKRKKMPLARLGRLAACLASCSLLVSACSAGGASPSAPGSVVQLSTATPPVSVSPSVAPTAVLLASPSPTAILTPAPFDVEKFVADLESGAALQEYPAVSGSALQSLYKSTSQSDPDLGDAVMGNSAYAGKASNLDLCLNLVPGEDNVEDPTVSCPYLVAALVRYTNQTGRSDDLSLLHAALGYVLNVSDFRLTSVTQLEQLKAWMEGRCGKLGDLPTPC
jgi:hypothetical protein